jgi:hypothetical protein
VDNIELDLRQIKWDGMDWIDILPDKLVICGICGKTIRWFRSYLENMKQRVELCHHEKGKIYSNWETVKYGVPQGQILGPLLFLLYISDLPLGINTDVKLTLHMDDTSVLIFRNNVHKTQAKLNIILNTLNNWFTNNCLYLDLKKTKLLKFETTYQKTSFQLSFRDELLHDETNIRFLWLEINKFMNWKTHVKLMLHKLGNACFAIKNMKYCSNIKTLSMIHHAYFHSIMKHGIIFWGDSPDGKNVFFLRKKTVRIMMGIKHRSTCRPAFKTLIILTLASQYLLLLMTFMINSLEHLTFNCAIRNKLTRHGGNLHALQSHLSLRQKGVCYMSVNIFNTLPNILVDLVGDENQFTGKLKETLIYNSVYSAYEFFDYCQDL